MSFSFDAKIAIINGNPYVRPPDNLLEKLFQKAGRKTSPIPIRGKLNNASFQQSLVRYQGDWRLYINGSMAKAAGIKYSGSISAIVSRNVTIQLEFDPSPPKYIMVPLFQKALDKNPVAKKSWGKLIPSRKKEILRYFSWLKGEEAQKRNLEKAMSALSGKEERFMARTWKDGK